MNATEFEFNGQFEGMLLEEQQHQLDVPPQNGHSSYYGVSQIYSTRQNPLCEVAMDSTKIMEGNSPPSQGYPPPSSYRFERRRCLEYEKSKLERKRERNRIAASKCRQRKIERISTLEKQVHELKEENQKLLELMQSFKMEVHSLRGQLQYHLERGCDVRDLKGFNTFGRPIHNNNNNNSHDHQIKSEFNVADSSTC